MSASRLVRLLLITYLVLFSLWPFYIDLRIADSIGVNPQRVALALLIFASLVAFTADRGVRIKGLQQIKRYRALVVALVAYSVLRLVSAAPVSTASLLIAIYEIMSNVALLLVALVYIRNADEARPVFLTLVCCGLLLAGYAVLERSAGSNFFAQYANTETRAGWTAALIKLRDGIYRVQATFEHPLSLVQYLVVVAPFATLFLKNRTWFLLSLIALPFMAVAAIFTGSRSALVAPVAGALVTLAVSAYGRYKRHKSRSALLGLTVAVVFAAIVSSTAFIDLLTGVGSSSQAASSATRIAQVQNGLIAIKNKPFLGYGPGQASAVIMNVGETASGSQTIFRETTDNLFLTRAIESGIPALAIYIYIIFTVLRTSARSVIQSATGSRAINLALLTSTVAGALTMVILSIFTVLPLLFVVFGMALGLAPMSDASRPREWNQPEDTDAVAYNYS